MVIFTAPGGEAQLRLHPSLVNGLWREAGIEGRSFVDVGDADKLDHWANEINEFPSGQKSNLARSLASLVRVFGSMSVSTKVESTPSGSFWDAVAR